MPDDPFDGVGYSPKRIRFFLLHWTSLRSIAEYPAGGRGELDSLRREWEIVTTDPTVSGVCACHLRQHYRSTPEEYHRSGGYHPESAHTVTILLADLEAATDRLPLPWHSTARVFAAQQRLDTWAARIATYRELGLLGTRAQDRLIEPSDGDHVVFRLLAQALGWRTGDALDTLSETPYSVARTGMSK